MPRSTLQCQVNAWLCPQGQLPTSAHPGRQQEVSSPWQTQGGPKLLVWQGQWQLRWTSVYGVNQQRGLSAWLAL